MKKILFSLTMLIALMSTATAWAIEGDGSAETPFIITNQEELELISDFPECNFELANDIVLEGDFVPLCTYGDSFTGNFDGKGYTISNFSITNNYLKIGLFTQNNGTIKNLNISTSETGINFNFNTSETVYIGIISAINNGDIHNCNVIGNILYNNLNRERPKVYIGSVSGKNNMNISKIASDCKIKSTMHSYNSYNTTGSYGGMTTVSEFGGTCYLGGIAGINNSDISEVFSKGDLIISSAYQGNIGGIAGIQSNGSISNSYFIGNMSSTAYEKSYTRGIAGCYTSGTNIVENTYSVATHTANNSLGIAPVSYCTTTNCFYDKTVSNLSDIESGTPKSTMAMKMKQTYTTAEWDFDTIWAIDSNINDGYPYLRWAYGEPEQLPDYTINSLTLTDESGNVLETIPETGNVYAEINVKKNSDSKETDCIIIACYDENGALTDIEYMKGLYNRNQEMVFGALLKNNGVKTIKTFVWNSLTDMLPLSNTISY